MLANQSKVLLSASTRQGDSYLRARQDGGLLSASQSGLRDSYLLAGEDKGTHICELDRTGDS
jgi:hypothetical protein